MTTHLVGIGGAGMSGIARVLAQRGETVTGCDRAHSLLLDQLGREGIACRVGHDPAHLDGCDRVVVSGAIPDDAPELLRARELGLPVQHRAEALAAILADHDRRVVVTGAHGKTTTSSMLAAAAVELGLDPTFVVGGSVRQLGTNARGGAGGLAIAEGDESDRSVLGLPATIGVILNVDYDHLDHYGSVEEVRALLDEWARTIPADGLVAVGDGVEVHPAAHALPALCTPGTCSRTRAGPRDGRNATPSPSGAASSARRPSPGPTPKRAIGAAGRTSTPSPTATRPSAGIVRAHSSSSARTSSTDP